MLINRPLPPGVVHGPSPDHFYIILREFERRTLYIGAYSPNLPYISVFPNLPYISAQSVLKNVSCEYDLTGIPGTYTAVLRSCQFRCGTSSIRVVLIERTMQAYLTPSHLMRNGEMVFEKFV